MKRLQAIRLCLLALALINTQPALAVIEYITDPNTGKLVQANGVMVDLDGNSILEEYQVRFEDGAFNAVYEAGSIPAFIQSLSHAESFSQALLDQVFNGLPPGEVFDVESQFTSGCTNTTYCYINTPYVISEGVVYNSTTVNFSPDNPAGRSDYINNGYKIPYLYDTTQNDYNTWAVWSASTQVSAVTEPTSIAMMLIGVLMLSVVTHRRKL